MALFNSLGGIGTTTLAFNIAHMMARQGLRTAVVDFDPQCSLSVVSLIEEELAALWEHGSPGSTVAKCIDPIRTGKGDLLEPDLLGIAPDLWILPGDPALRRFELPLAESWGRIHQPDNERAMRVATALLRLAESVATRARADCLIVDTGPNLGALSRAALLAADIVIVPVAPDLFSVQGLRSAGPALQEWRDDWERAVARSDPWPRAHPFTPVGYIVQRHVMYANRPSRAHVYWTSQIPAIFREHVLGEQAPSSSLPVEKDPYCIAMMRDFATLVLYSQQSRKPIFDLKVADGIGGGHIQAVLQAHRQFEQLVQKLRGLLGLQ